MFQKIAKHRANDASLTMHRPPLPPHWPKTGGKKCPLTMRWNVFLPQRIIFQGKKPDRKTLVFFVGLSLIFFHWSCIFLLIGFKRAHLVLRQFWFLTLQWANKNFQTLFHQSKFSLWPKWIFPLVLSWQNQRKNTSPFEFYFQPYLLRKLGQKCYQLSHAEIVDHMGQFLQDGENACFVSFFLK